MKYILLEENSMDNLNTVIRYLGCKYNDKEFRVCYKDFKNNVALVCYEE